MGIFGQARRFLRKKVIPLFGHYAASAAHTISKRFPSAANFVSRVLDRGLGWGYNTSAALNVNPTFGVAPPPSRPMPPARAPIAGEPRARFMFPWDSYPTTSWDSPHRKK